MDKKNFILRSFGYDISKRWYLETRINGKRVRKYGNINQYPTIAERMTAVDALLDKLAASPPRCGLFFK